MTVVDALPNSSIGAPALGLVMFPSGEDSLARVSALRMFRDRAAPYRAALDEGCVVVSEYGNHVTIGATPATSLPENVPELLAVRRLG